MNQYPYGVVIGRFQVPELHAGHKHLLSEAAHQSARLLVLVGSAGANFTARNPLPYDARHAMLAQYFQDSAFPKTTIACLHDASSDEAWTARVDELVKHHFGPAAAFRRGIIFATLAREKL